MAYDLLKGFTSEDNTGKCLVCWKPETKIVRLLYGLPTQNISSICENPGCLMYININNVKTWKPIEKSTIDNII